VTERAMGAPPCQGAGTYTIARTSICAYMHDTGGMKRRRVEGPEVPEVVVMRVPKW
jgi:hypothetical protein